jgi:glycerol-3-phosphate acyltransferase PlsY
MPNTKGFAGSTTGTSVATGATSVATGFGAQAEINIAAAMKTVIILAIIALFSIFLSLKRIVERFTAFNPTIHVNTQLRSFEIVA